MKCPDPFTNGSSLPRFESSVPPSTSYHSRSHHLSSHDSSSHHALSHYSSSHHPFHKGVSWSFCEWNVLILLWIVKTLFINTLFDDSPNWPFTISSVSTVSLMKRPDPLSSGISFTIWFLGDSLLDILSLEWGDNDWGDLLEVKHFVIKSVDKLQNKVWEHFIKRVYTLLALPWPSTLCQELSRRLYTVVKVRLFKTRVINWFTNNNLLLSKRSIHFYCKGSRRFIIKRVNTLHHQKGQHTFYVKGQNTSLSKGSIHFTRSCWYRWGVAVSCVIVSDID